MKITALIIAAFAAFAALAPMQADASTGSDQRPLQAYASTGSDQSPLVQLQNAQRNQRQVAWEDCDVLIILPLVGPVCIDLGLFVG